MPPIKFPGPPMGSAPKQLSRWVPGEAILLVLLTFLTVWTAPVVQAEPIPKPHEFLGRLDDLETKSNRFELFSKTGHKVSVQIRTARELKAMENEVQTSLDNGNSVVVVEVGEYMDSNGNIETSSPIVLGSGSSMDKVLSDNYSGKAQLRYRGYGEYSAFGKGYIKGGTRFYSYSKGSDGKLVRTGPLINYGGPSQWGQLNYDRTGQWVNLNEASAKARALMERLAEAARARDRELAEEAERARRRPAVQPLPPKTQPPGGPAPTGSGGARRDPADGIGPLDPRPARDASAPEEKTKPTSEPTPTTPEPAGPKESSGEGSGSDGDPVEIPPRL